MDLHIFSGKFPSLETACLYTEPQWEPAPPSHVSNEVFKEWENRNPTWSLASDLNCYLDADFIETIDGEDRFEYLSSLGLHPENIRYIKDKSPSHYNILLLIFHEALGGLPVTLSSTNLLLYLGRFTIDLN